MVVVVAMGDVVGGGGVILAMACAFRVLWSLVAHRHHARARSAVTAGPRFSFS